jgi:hypothetical protein
MSANRRYRWTVVLMAASLLPLSGGCSIIGVAAHKLSGSSKIPPLYVLPKEPTIVIVDRPVNFGEVALDAQRIGRDVTTALEQKKVAPMLDAGLATEMRSRTTADGRRLRPTELAAACGAKQIIYIELGRYDSSSAVGGDAMDGHADAKIWVIDVATAEVRWPAEANRGYAVSAEVPFTPLAGAVSEQTLHGRMNAALAEKISRVFTGWTEE